MTKTAIRCAIYTRKSSDEGLEQEFNSLDAQRESCASYIQSQRHEGWTLVRTRYDDGGYSGGTLERPALKQLMADVEAGRVHVIVVYKVDRLTRSLSDFARIVDVLDRKGASFVSVTQQFNTTSSMGRLTLNVLLSFAQFEREVTGERIRDKIAASKKKGMWMGGAPPLGYDLVERKLIVNHAEAKAVRRIYELYLSLGRVTGLSQELQAEGIRSKRWVSQQGISHGGVPFARGALYRILRNWIYLGQIEHKGNVYEGEHDAIVDQEMWDDVQQLLAKHRKRKSGNWVDRDSWILQGILFDENGSKMSPHYTRKKQGRLYRYYVDATLLHHTGTSPAGKKRAPAQPLEDAVTEALQGAVASTRQVETPNAWREWLSVHVDAIHLGSDHFVIALRNKRLSDNELKRLSANANTDPDKDAVTVRVPFQVQRRGGKTIIVNAESDDVPRRIDPPIIKSLVRAWRWRRMLESGKAKSLEDIARQEGIGARHVRKHFSLAFLAPDLVEALLDGRQPVTVNLTRLTAHPLPYCWKAQREVTGILMRSKH